MFFYNSRGNIIQVALDGTLINLDIDETIQGSIEHVELMKDDYIELHFNTKSPVLFPIGTHCTYNGKLYYVLDKQKPSPTTKGLEYKLKLESYYMAWKHILCMYNKNNGGESSWTLAGDINMFGNVLIHIITDEGIKYNGINFVFSVDSTVTTDINTIEFSAVSIIEALNLIAEKFECEWWITDNIIHFGKCELGTIYTKLEVGEEISSCSPSNSSDTFANRIYAFGSDRNIPTTYRKHLQFTCDTIGTKNGKTTIFDSTRPIKTTYFSGAPNTSTVVQTHIKFLTGSYAGNTYNATVNPDGVLNGGLIMLDVSITPSTTDTYSIPSLLSSQVPESYYTADNDYVKNSVVQNRLALSDSKPYVGIEDLGDISNLNIDEDDAIVPAIVIFEKEYPKLTSTVQSVTVQMIPYKDSDGNILDEKYPQYTVVLDQPTNFDKKYVTGTLKCALQSGLLAGTEYELEFNSGNSFAIVNNSDYGRQLPDLLLLPKVGDTLLLYNYDTEYFYSQSISDAESHLRQTAITYLRKKLVDPATYSCKANVNENNAMELGAKVNLIASEYIKSNVVDGVVIGRKSRIYGYEKAIDGSSLTYTVGESTAYSRLNSLESKVESIEYNGASYQYAGSGNGASVYLIVSDDSTPASESNTFSAKRIIKELEKKLSNTYDDTSYGLIKFLKGIGIGNTYGITDKGVASLFKLVLGQYYFDEGGNIKSDSIRNAGSITTDILTVTGIAHFFKLVIDQIKAAGGAYIFTPADGIEVDDVVPDSDKYRLFWKATDGSGKFRANMWEVGDQALCMDFNYASAGTSNNTDNNKYWHLVTGVSSASIAHTIDGVEYQCNYIDLSVTDKWTDSNAVPYKGDSVAMLGHRLQAWETDTARQSAVYISAYTSLDAGLTSPLLAFYRGIDNFDLASHRKTYFDAHTNKFVGDFSITTDDGDVNITDYINSKLSAAGNAQLNFDAAQIIIDADTDGKNGHVRSAPSMCYVTIGNTRLYLNTSVKNCVNVDESYVFASGNKFTSGTAFPVVEGLLCQLSANASTLRFAWTISSPSAALVSGQILVHAKIYTASGGGVAIEKYIPLIVNKNGADGSDAWSISLSQSSLIFTQGMTNKDDFGLANDAYKVLPIAYRGNTSRICDIMTVNAVHCTARVYDASGNELVNGTPNPAYMRIVSILKDGNGKYYDNGYVDVITGVNGVHVETVRLSFAVNMLGTYKETIVADTKTAIMTSKEYTDLSTAVNKNATDISTANTAITEVRTKTTTLKETADGLDVQVFNLLDTTNELGVNLGNTQTDVSNLKIKSDEISLTVKSTTARDNLLRGSAFRKLDEFTINGRKQDISISINKGYAGTNALFVNSVYTGSTSDGVIFRNIPCTPGAKYTWSVMTMSPDITTIGEYVVIEVRAYKADGTFTRLANESAKPSVNNTYKLFSGTVTVPSDTDAATKIDHLEYLIYVSTSGQLYICRPMVEAGDTYKGWSLSKDDADYVGGNMLANSRLLSDPTGANKAPQVVAIPIADAPVKTAQGLGAYTTAYKSSNFDADYTKTPVMWEDSLVLEKGSDYMFSMWVKGSGYVFLNLYNGTGTGDQPTAYVETSDGYSGTDADGFCYFKLTSDWRRVWVHWRTKAEFTDYVKMSLIPFRHMYDSTKTGVLGSKENITTIAAPKLEKGATMTEYSESAEDMITKSGLLACGIDITSHKILATADNFYLQNNSGQLSAAVDESGNLSAGSLSTMHSNGNPYIFIKDGIMEVHGNIAINIRFGVNAIGMAVLSYYDNSGKLLYDLGPSGITASDLAKSQWEEVTFVSIVTIGYTESTVPAADTNVMLQDAKKLFTLNSIYNITTLYRYHAGMVNGVAVKDAICGFADANSASSADGMLFTARYAGNLCTGTYTQNNGNHIFMSVDKNYYKEFVSIVQGSITSKKWLCSSFQYQIANSIKEI